MRRTEIARHMDRLHGKSILRWVAICVPGQCSNRVPCPFDAVECSAMGSINVGSSPFPGLLTRFDTGHIRKVSFGGRLEQFCPRAPRQPRPDILRLEDHWHAVVNCTILSGRKSSPTTSRLGMDQF